MTAILVGITDQGQFGYYFEIDPVTYMHDPESDPSDMEMQIDPTLIQMHSDWYHCDGRADC